MRIRLLFTLGLVLLLSTLASSNECARYGKKCDGCKNLAVPVAKPLASAPTMVPANKVSETGRTPNRSNAAPTGICSAANEK